MRSTSRESQLAELPVLIVDYGLGNMFSVQRALRRHGVEAMISSEKADIERAARLVLPGVGAFGDGMKNLNRMGLSNPIRAFADSGRPLLGVCLGMQLLVTRSEEFGTHQGLGIVKGEVLPLHPPETGNRVKVPHIGWNSLKPSGAREHDSDPWEGTVLAAVAPHSYMYFVHSFMVHPANPREVSIAATSHGHDTFCSVFRQGNVTGTQFHPERSGDAGLSLYKSFLLQG